MPEIDPIQFGKLQAQVENMSAEVEDLRRDVKTLLGMAERSKGALFAGMSIASVVGGAVTMAVQHFFKGP